ncbi:MULTISPECIES: hypothetical protein [unclassified Arenimonas]|uniref:hypothetical protein n=1 Tax=unclassified Arenimonas TaxID=2641713 RepID=UPI0025BD74A6|nr:MULTISPECIES: hypothetical protein [unclassified Arenimonas]
MKRLLMIALSALAFFPGLAPATGPAADDAVFVEGARYDAVLHRREHRWRLLPAEGADLRLRVSETCRAGELPPRGLWLLTLDAAGHPTLVAPSATPLPSGHPGMVRLVGCDQPLPAGLPALTVPAALSEWLAENSGAIYVTD